MCKILLLTFLLGITASTAIAQDPVQVDSKHYKILFENDQVRVLKIHYNPKEKSVMHEHPASVVVFLSNSKNRFTLADGTTTDNAGKAGQVGYSEAEKHLPENVGSTPVNAILVELKGEPATTSTKVDLDPVEVDPEHHKVEIENDRVRVLRIKFKPHDKTREHEHPDAVAIFLTSGPSKFTLADGKTREASRKAGEAVWAAGEKHMVENPGNKPAEVILVELKK